MKYLLITIAAVVLVGCGESQQPNPESGTPTPEPVVSIHSAAGLGEDEIVKQHLADGVDINLKDEVGFTPLHKAVQSRSIGMVDVLVAEGADVNAKDRSGMTPLFLTVFLPSKEIAELLIKNGADVNTKDGRGRTPLDLAIQQKETEYAELLRKHEGKSGANDSIHIAASVGNIAVVKQHLAAGVDVNVNAQRNDGWTPLHTAARFGQKEVSELLIAKGANVNASDNRGGTPLDAAIVGQTIVTREEVITHKNPENAALLRKHGGKTGEELKAEGK